MSAIAPTDIRVARKEQMFPQLTAAQIARLEPHGKHVTMRKGEVLIEPGQRGHAFLVVLSGVVEVVRPGLSGEEIIVVHRAGHFAGEMSSLRGAAALVRARAAEDGELLAIDVERLRAVVQTDSELSELLMRAFILRRVGLIGDEGSGGGDAIVIGSRHCAYTLQVRQFLSRNGFPYQWIDVESDPSVQDLLDRFHVRIEDVPVVICHGQTVLRHPSNRELADCLGMNPEIDGKKIRDLVVIGAGPAGLAAAVYGASEGLDVLVLEVSAPGGQAGSSSKIENYLGFPTGISGQALAGRALVQAQKFGAEVNVASGATRLYCERHPHEIVLSDGRLVRSRSIVIASGAQYRRLEEEGIERYLGAGVYYAATAV